MTDEEIKTVGLSLWRIAQLVDEETFERIKPSLDAIQEVALRYTHEES